MFKFKEQDFELNFYERLDVAPDADHKTIRTAYRKLAIDTHPDTHPDDKEKEAEFVAISRAYECLGSEDDRAAYNRELSMRRPASGKAASYAPRTDIHQSGKPAASSNETFHRAGRQSHDDFYSRYKYEPEEVEKYKPIEVEMAEIRLRAGTSRNGDLSKTFNWYAGGTVPRTDLALGAGVKSEGKALPKDENMLTLGDGQKSPVQRGLDFVHRLTG